MTETVADRFETEGVVTERVAFECEGHELVGDLHRPEGRDGERLPGLVVTGSWLTVKEQMAGLYARRLAARGFAALAFDFRGFGESGGEPRQYEDPETKAADIAAAVGYMAARDDVAEGGLGGVGVCASSGYQALNAISDDRVGSLVLIAPWLHDAELVAPLYGGAEGVRERIEAGERARDRWESEGEVDYVPAVSESDETAAMYGPFAYYLDPERGRIEQWSDRFAVMSWPKWLGFDAVALGASVRQPTLLHHSEDAAVPDGAKSFAASLAEGDAEWVDGDQFAFYDQEPNVGRAVDAAERHLRRTLASAQAG